jgi:hypothetical protein
MATDAESGPNLNVLVATLVLFLTVVAALGLGVWAAGWLVNSILDAFGGRTQSEAAVLVPSETHASGD